MVQAKKIMIYVVTVFALYTIITSPSRAAIYGTYSAAFGFGLLTLLIPLVLRRSLR